MKRVLLEKNHSLTGFELLNWATSYFISIGIESSRLEAELLLSYALGINKVDLYLGEDWCLSDLDLCLFTELLARRARREPVSYIIGHKEFWSLDFKVNRNVLIPRPETECLVRSVVPLLKDDFNPSMKILDIGTGSGAIVIALANENSSHKFYALDISPDAICVAQKNAIMNELDNSISFFLSYWTDALGSDSAKFDLIVSNPPYVKSDSLGYLQPEITFYEPIIALDGGVDGLDSFRKIIKESLLYLRRGGLLALEIGSEQGDKVGQIADFCEGYSNIRVIRDYDGRDRVIHMTKI